MKVGIIQLMKTAAATALSNHIIKVNRWDEELNTQPPLISFCEATKFSDKNNLDLCVL